MKQWMFAIAACAMAGSALAADADLSVTIYNNNLALVQDTRTLDIASGRSRLEFKDVSASIRPETVSLAASGVEIVEQNFDYDLLSPDKMMEKAVGSQVRIVRINPGNGKETTETATVLAVNNGVVLKIGDRIEVLRDDGVPTRVIFDKVPENLRARPTLSVSVQSQRGGPREATLSYLTTGLSWKADYVALFDEKKGALDMQGWITLNNTSGTAYTNAETRLVAGDVQLTSDTSSSYYPPRRSSGMSSGGTETGEGGIADYYIYPLPQRTTIAENQTKQVGFLEARGAKAKKVYEYRSYGFDSQSEPQHADVVLQFSNAKASGLGAPLPAGIVRVYVRDADGEPRFVGENSIDHTPQGSELSIKTGDAFDVTVLPTSVSSERESKTRTKQTMSYLIRSARAEPITVEIRQKGLGRDGRVISESIKSTRIDAQTLGWSVPVAANGETTLTFTVSTGW